MKIKALRNTLGFGLCRLEVKMMNGLGFQKYINAVLVVLLALALGFVITTTQSLPNVVASHFNASGVANGFMDRQSYLISMLAAIIGLPGLMSLTGMWFSKLPVSMINIPHREHWLAPERSALTLQALQTFMTVLACCIVIFLSFVHWLVVLANQEQTPALTGHGVYVGLILFLFVIGVWSWLLHRQFQLTDQDQTSVNQ
jgi:uncharacterized membrane protein